MSILQGVLHLFDPTAPRGLRLPIDVYLRSLAEDRQARSIPPGRSLALASTGLLIV